MYVVYQMIVTFMKVGCFKIREYSSSGLPVEGYKFRLYSCFIPVSI